MIRSGIRSEVKMDENVPMMRKSSLIMTNQICNISVSIPEAGSPSQINHNLIVNSVHVIDLIFFLAGIDCQQVSFFVKWPMHVYVYIHIYI